MHAFESDSLYHVFTQVVRFSFQRKHMLLEKVGIYPGQPAMLIALYHKDGQNQKELAKKLFIKPATITVMLKRMEKAELVERRQDPNDMRVSRVYLTENGKKICKEVDKIMKIIDVESFQNFTQEEQDLLLKLLIKMRDNLIKACNENREE